MKWQYHSGSGWKQPKSINGWETHIKNSSHLYNLANFSYTIPCSAYGSSVAHFSFQQKKKKFNGPKKKTKQKKTTSVFENLIMVTELYKEEDSRVYNIGD